MAMVSWFQNVTQKIKCPGYKRQWVGDVAIWGELGWPSYQPGSTMKLMFPDWLDSPGMLSQKVILGRCRQSYCLWSEFACRGKHM